MHTPAMFVLSLCIVSAVGTSLIAFALRRQLRAWWRSRTAKRNAAKYATGEARAAHLLRQRGFHIVRRNEQVTYTIRVDDELAHIALRPDFVVTRAGRTWVADAKTGASATQAIYPPTRRQLLEYAHAFGATGVLLVDADQAEIHTVCFGPNEDQDAARFSSQCIGFATLAVISCLIVWLC